ncbi:MAG: hypothetical protein PHZ19_09445 [Candidatus Thermoplasmatota archaeon]|nr:hypothetical protein [Candidatus Thermoplasmatota archaeon]
MPLPPEFLEKVRQYTLRVALELKAEIQQNIVNNGSVYEGYLLNSIQVVTLDDGTVVVGSPLHYAPNIEFGTRPHSPLVEPLQEWARKKLKARDFEKVGLAIAQHIARYGTPPAPFMRPAFDNIDAVKARVTANF